MEPLFQTEFILNRPALMAFGEKAGAQTIKSQLSKRIVMSVFYIILLIIAICAIHSIPWLIFYFLLTVVYFLLIWPFYKNNEKSFILNTLRMSVKDWAFVTKYSIQSSYSFYETSIHVRFCKENNLLTEKTFYLENISGYWTFDNYFVFFIQNCNFKSQLLFFSLENPSSIADFFDSIKIPQIKASDIHTFLGSF